MIFDVSKLKFQYDKYSEINGAPISLEESQHISNVIYELQPKLILDLGSGWSSFLFREICKDSKIISVDTNKSWLKKSIQFCIEQNVEIDNFMSWDVLSEMHSSLIDKVDFVFHDMGDRKLREKTTKWVLDVVRPNGYVIFDDMHKNDLKNNVQNAINSHKNKFEILDLESKTALDKQGRWCWTVKRKDELCDV